MRAYAGVCTCCLTAIFFIFLSFPLIHTEPLPPPSPLISVNCYAQLHAGVALRTSLTESLVFVRRPTILCRPLEYHLSYPKRVRPQAYARLVQRHRSFGRHPLMVSMRDWPLLCYLRFVSNEGERRPQTYRCTFRRAVSSSSRHRTFSLN